MNLVSRAEIARRKGVSRPAITQAIKDGRLPIVGKGNKAQIDLDDARVIEYLHNDSRQQRQIKKEEPERPASQSRMQSEELPDISNERYEQGQDIADLIANSDLRGVLGQFTKSEIEKIKLFEQINQMRLKNERERKELISRDVVQKVFSKLYSVDVNEFLQFSAILASRICDQVFGDNTDEKVLQTEKIITDESYKTLNHIKRILEDYSKTYGEIEGLVDPREVEMKNGGKHDM